MSYIKYLLVCFFQLTLAAHALANTSSSEEPIDSVGLELSRILMPYVNSYYELGDEGFHANCMENKQSESDDSWYEYVIKIIFGTESKVDPTLRFECEKTLKAIQAFTLDMQYMFPKTSTGRKVLEEFYEEEGDSPCTQEKHSWINSRYDNVPKDIRQEFFEKLI